MVSIAQPLESRDGIIHPGGRKAHSELHTRGKTSAAPLEHVWAAKPCCLKERQHDAEERNWECSLVLRPTLLAEAGGENHHHHTLLSAI